MEKETRVDGGVAREKRAEEGSCKGKEADRNVPHDESGLPCLTSARSSLSRPARRYYARREYLRLEIPGPARSKGTGLLDRYVVVS